MEPYLLQHKQFPDVKRKILFKENNYYQTILDKPGYSPTPLTKDIIEKYYYIIEYRPITTQSNRRLSNAAQ